MRAWLGRMFGGQKELSWRRLFAFVVASGLVVYGQIDQWAWVTIAGLYIGSEAAEKVAVASAGRGKQLPGGTS